MPAAPRYAGCGFAIGTKGYVAGGFDGNTNYKDFWEYDPVMDSWTQKPDFGGESRAYAVGFSVGSNGYIGLGSQGNNGGVNLQDFWVYGQ